MKVYLLCALIVLLFALNVDAGLNGPVYNSFYTFLVSHAESVGVIVSSHIVHVDTSLGSSNRTFFESVLQRSTQFPNYTASFLNSSRINDILSTNGAEGMVPYFCLSLFSFVLLF